jgi:hypothetical protein
MPNGAGTVTWLNETCLVGTGKKKWNTCGTSVTGYIRSLGDFRVDFEPKPTATVLVSESLRYVRTRNRGFNMRQITDNIRLAVQTGSRSSMR